MLEGSNVLSPSLIFISKSSYKTVCKIKLVFQALSFFFHLSLIFFSFIKLLFETINTFIDHSHFLLYNL